MKKTILLLPLVFLFTLGAPSAALAACPASAPIEDNGQCYSKNPDGSYTRAVGVVPDNSPATGVTSSSVNQKWLQYYYQLILWIINSVLVPVLIAVAFIVFLWGIFKAFVWNAASETEKAEGRKFAMWGIIGLVIIVSVWGLVNMVKETIIPSTASDRAPAYPKL